MQNRQHKVAVFAPGGWQIALQLVIEAEQLFGTRAVRNQGVEWGQERGRLGLQGGSADLLKQSEVIGVYIYWFAFQPRHLHRKDMTCCLQIQ